MITEENIRKYVEKEFKVDLKATDRKRNTVYAKVIYSKLCLDFVKYNKKPISKWQISVNLNMHHATILHYLVIVFDVIQFEDKEAYNIYKRFSSVTKYNSDDDIRYKFSILLNDFVNASTELKKIKENNIISNIDFEEIIKTVPNDKMDLFLFRIKPIAKMLNSNFIN